MAAIPKPTSLPAVPILANTGPRKMQSTNPRTPSAMESMMTAPRRRQNPAKAGWADSGESATGAGSGTGFSIPENIIETGIGYGLARSMGSARPRASVQRPGTPFVNEAPVAFPIGTMLRREPLNERERAGRAVAALEGIPFESAAM